MAYSLRVSNADAVLDALAGIQETQEVGRSWCNNSKVYGWVDRDIPAPVPTNRFLVSMESDSRVIRETDTCAPCVRDPNGQDAEGNDCDLLDGCMIDQFEYSFGYGFWMGAIRYR